MSDTSCTVGDKRKADRLSRFAEDMAAERAKRKAAKEKEKAPYEWTSGEKCHMVFMFCEGQGPRVSYVPEVCLDPVVKFLVSKLGNIEWDNTEVPTFTRDVESVLTKKKLDALKKGEEEDKEEDKDDDDTSVHSMEVMNHVTDWVEGIYTKCRFKPTVPVVHGGHIVVTVQIEY